MSESHTSHHASKNISGEVAVLARRYAEAIYDSAEEQKQLDPVAAELSALRDVLRADPFFFRLANYPRMTRPQAAKMMKEVAETSKLSPMVTRFLEMMAMHRRLPLLDHAIDSFLARLAAQRKEITAEVATAQALTPAQTEKLAAHLHQVAGGKVNMIVKEDASLLGGLVVKLGSRLIDASIKGKLERLERQLKAQQEAA